MASDQVVIAFIVMNGILAICYQYASKTRTLLLRFAIWLDVLAKSNVAEQVLVVIGKVSGRGTRIFAPMPNISSFIFALSSLLALLSVLHYTTDSHLLMLEASVARQELLGESHFRIPAEMRASYQSMPIADFKKAFQWNMILASQGKIHLANGVFLIIFLVMARSVVWLLRNAAKSRLVRNSNDLVGAFLLSGASVLLIGSMFVVGSWIIFNSGSLGITVCRAGLFLLNSIGFVADALPAGGFYPNFPHIHIGLQEVFGSGVIRGAANIWIEYAKFILGNLIPITFGRAYILQEVVFVVLLFGLVGPAFLALNLPLLTIVGQRIIRKLAVPTLEWIERNFIGTVFLLNVLLTGAYTYWSRPV